MFFLEGFALIRARAGPRRTYTGPYGSIWARETTKNYNILKKQILTIRKKPKLPQKSSFGVSGGRPGGRRLSAAAGGRLAGGHAGGRTGGREVPKLHLLVPKLASEVIS